MRFVVYMCPSIWPVDYGHAVPWHAEAQLESRLWHVDYDRAVPWYAEAIASCDTFAHACVTHACVTRACVGMIPHDASPPHLIVYLSRHAEWPQLIGSPPRAILGMHAATHKNGPPVEN